MYANEYFSDSERALLHGLQQQALRYFIENQLPHGLILDRQHNHGRRKFTGLCSTAATGMGLVNIALASTREHGLLSRRQACERIRRALRTALSMRHVHGMLPHFLDAKTLKPVGEDAISTIDSSWFIAGAAWATELLNDSELTDLTSQFCSRVDWNYWSKLVPGAVGEDDRLLISHGTDSTGAPLPGVWDRLNAETAFMYVMAIGADESRALPASSWFSLKPFISTVADLTFTSADLGLFVFQYSLLGLKGELLPPVNGVDLFHECMKGMLANYAASKYLGSTFKTFKRFWGLSAGDGPNPRACGPDVYRPYSPVEEVDGTAHLMATLASVDAWPRLVLENCNAVRGTKWRKARGRYGFSNINVDRDWFSEDVVGIDVGAAAMSLENVLYDDRVRNVTHRLAPVTRALERLSNI